MGRPMTVRVGDIVATPKGEKWRIVHAARDIVRAEHVDTGVVSHLHRDDITLLEPYPGDGR